MYLLIHAGMKLNHLSKMEKEYFDKMLLGIYKHIYHSHSIEVLNYLDFDYILLLFNPISCS